MTDPNQAAETLALKYQACAASSGQQVLRMRIALEILREWGIRQAFNARAIMVVYDWIDAGMEGPLPWPGGAFFDEWAAGRGLVNEDGHCSYRIEMDVANGE